MSVTLNIALLFMIILIIDTSAVEKLQRIIFWLLCKSKAIF